MATKSFGITVTADAKAVGELTDVNIDGVDVNMIDVTNHGSTGGYMEFLGGLKDGGNMSLAGNYDEADTGQEELRDNPAKSAAIIVTFSDGTKATFTGIYGPYAVTGPLDDKIGFTASVKVTGQVTYAAAI